MLVYAESMSKRTAAQGSLNHSRDESETVIIFERDAGYWEYDAGEGCPYYLNDAPVIRLESHLNGKRKRILHDLGCFVSRDNLSHYPQELYRLEELIDEIANSSQWIK